MKCKQKIIQTSNHTVNNINLTRPGPTSFLLFIFIFVSEQVITKGCFLPNCPRPNIIQDLQELFGYCFNIYELNINSSNFLGLKFYSYIHDYTVWIWIPTSSGSFLYNLFHLLYLMENLLRIFHTFALDAPTNSIYILSLILILILIYNSLNSITLSKDHLHEL